MSTNVIVADRTIALPKGWQQASLTLYFEGEDLSKQDQPFAANVVVTNRLEALAKASPADVAAKDLRDLGSALPGFDLVDNGELKMGAHHAPFLEYEFADGPSRRLCQLVIYCAMGKKLFTFTGTHVAGKQFAAVRADMVKIAERALEGGK